MAVCQVDRGVVIADGSETDCEGKAFIGQSAPYKSGSFLQKHTLQGRYRHRARFCQRTLVSRIVTFELRHA